MVCGATIEPGQEIGILFYIDLLGADRSDSLQLAITRPAAPGSVIKSEKLALEDCF